MPPMAIQPCLFDACPNGWPARSAESLFKQEMTCNAWIFCFFRCKAWDGNLWPDSPFQCHLAFRFPVGLKILCPVIHGIFAIVVNAEQVQHVSDLPDSFSLTSASSYIFIPGLAAFLINEYEHDSASQSIALVCWGLNRGVVGSALSSERDWRRFCINPSPAASGRHQRRQGHL